jgi:SPP1 family predicted phage head-tail adaptor
MKHCGKYHAGQLREPVLFERLTRVSDGMGGATETWAAIAGAPTRGFVKAVSGFERLASDRQDATTRLRLVTRYKAGLREADRVKIRGRLHQIRFINNLDFANDWLEIDLDGGVAV